MPLRMPMSKIVIGGMRFGTRDNAAAIIRAAVDAGFNYIDLSPCYSYQSGSENAEAWAGDVLAQKTYRERLLVSTKSATGNGGWSLGQFMPEKGFGVVQADMLSGLVRKFGDVFI